MVHSCDYMRVLMPTQAAPCPHRRQLTRFCNMLQQVLGLIKCEIVNGSKWWRTCPRYGAALGCECSCWHIVGAFQNTIGLPMLQENAKNTTQAT